MSDRCSCRECRELDATPVEMQGIPGAWQQALFPTAQIPHAVIYRGECSECGMAGPAYEPCRFCAVPPREPVVTDPDLFGRRASRLAL